LLPDDPSIRAEPSHPKRLFFIEKTPLRPGQAEGGEKGKGLYF
jgi:hypothetical protein